MNIHATLPGQARHDLAAPCLDDYDRREELRARLEKDRDDEAGKFAARMAADGLAPEEFFKWANNGGTETLAKAFEDDDQCYFLQLIMKAHQHEDLQCLTRPIIERLKESARQHERENLSWLTD